MAQTPGRRDHQPGRPIWAPGHHHAGRRPPGRPLSVEGAHARNERTCIPAPVRMMRPDKLPAATIGFLHPALTRITAATSHSPPVAGGNRRAVPFQPCRYGTFQSQRTDFLTAAHDVPGRPEQQASLKGCR